MSTPYMVEVWAASEGRTFGFRGSVVGLRVEGVGFFRGVGSSLCLGEADFLQGRCASKLRTGLRFRVFSSDID